MPRLLRRKRGAENGRGPPLTSLPSQKDSRHGEAVLDNLQTLCSILANLGDALSIPVMKGIVSIAIDVIKTAQNVTSNKKDCESMARTITTHILILEAGRDLRKDIDIPKSLTLAYEELDRTLRHIHGVMKQISGKSRIKRVWYRQRDSNEVVDCKWQLGVALGLFNSESLVFLNSQAVCAHRDVRAVIAQSTALGSTLDETSQMLDAGFSGICAAIDYGLRGQNTPTKDTPSISLTSKDELQILLQEIVTKGLTVHHANLYKLMTAVLFIWGVQH